ncbi:MAG: hypothetical protein KIT68_04260 [Phycisphaeraceae bacterium]|nr:hypothetical protein [Phycisphaeraceae bacterium]
MTTPATNDSVRELAQLMHALWCRRRASEGWERGHEFDQETLRHDALVPFSELNELDTRDLMDAAQRLANQVDRVSRNECGGGNQPPARAWSVNLLKLL